MRQEHMALWRANLVQEVQSLNRPQRTDPFRVQHVVGAAAVAAGALLALSLKQPGWVFLIVAGIIVYNGGRLPKPHR
jgi:hypothetical protein